MKEKDKLEILKDILFTDDREFEEKISRRIELLEKTLNNRKKLSPKVTPIIEDQISEFTKSIPKTLGPVITATFKEEIKNHKDQVVDALYPVLGKMVKKYVAQEMKVLSEKINGQLGFIKSGKRKLRSWFGNANEEDYIMSEMSAARIEQVLLIEKDTGILKASYTKSRTIDEEMISGMLTAIKTFVEDAFDQRGQDLELIEYELYQIHIQSFVTHYMAVVISGNYTLKSKNKLQDIIFNFYHGFMAMNLDLVFDTPNLEHRVIKISKESLDKKLAITFGHAKI